jgi:hypothetical protein
MYTQGAAARDGLRVRLLARDAARRGLGAVREGDLEVDVRRRALLLRVGRVVRGRRVGAIGGGGTGRVGECAHGSEPERDAAEADVRDAYAVLSHTATSDLLKLREERKGVPRRTARTHA